MSTPDRLNSRKIAAHLQRVLIVDPTASARLLGDLLKQHDARMIHVETTTGGALTACGALDPQMVFTELTGPGLDGLAFVRALRRSTLACRKTPVIVVTAEATAATIMASRDCGVHEFIRKPFTVGDVVRRLEAVTLKARPWVEAVHYIGPDRRRFNSAEYAGRRKRKSDGRVATPTERIGQALKILRGAIDAIESDPMQALRAMQAQVAELQAVALDTQDLGLAQAVFQLNQTLKLAALDGKMTRPEVEASADGLWGFAPADTDAGKARSAA
jgi:DNA-binding response OmpR family regulator